MGTKNNAPKGSYEWVKAQLSGHNAKRFTANTFARLEGDRIIIKLYDTDIFIIIPDGSIMLNTGGFQTTTTKDRLNRYLPDAVSIYQKANQWYVNAYNGEFAYYDGIVIDGNGFVERGVRAEGSFAVERAT